jgi:hypothetical protein
LLSSNASGEPRQYLVGYLSAEDCESYLASRLTVQGQPLMDERIRRVITARSHGLPLYLDLAVMRFVGLHQRDGAPPVAGEFNYEFPALVARTFRDLTVGERQVLRAVSLLESFSVELASATAGLNQDGAALALVDVHLWTVMRRRRGDTSCMTWCAQWSGKRIPSVRTGGAGRTGIGLPNALWMRWARSSTARQGRIGERDRFSGCGLGGGAQRGGDAAA